jgi:hypothetical protein
MTDLTAASLPPIEQLETINNRSFYRLGASGLRAITQPTAVAIEVRHLRLPLQPWAIVLPFALWEALDNENYTVDALDKDPEVSTWQTVKRGPIAFAQIVQKWPVVIDVGPPNFRQPTCVVVNPTDYTALCDELAKRPT